MANITIGVDSPGILESWNTSPQRLAAGVPWGEITFTELGTAIAEKDALDNQMVSLVATCPRNYVYQLVEARLTVLAASNNIPADLASTWTCRLADATTRKPFYLENQASKMGIAGFDSFISAFSGNDTTSIFEPTSAGLPGGLFGPRGDSGILGDSPAILAFLLDVSADDTVAYVLDVYFRALAYTVDQKLNSQIHTPVRTIRG